MSSATAPVLDPGDETSHERFRVHRRPRTGTWISGALTAAVIGYVVWRLAENPSTRTDVVADYMFNPGILEGVGVTVQLTLLAGVISLGIGFLVAYAGQSRNPVARALSVGYIWFFRGVPLLVLLLFLFNLALFLPEISLGIPWTGWTRTWSTNTVITGFTAALLGLSLHEAAYMAEVFRGGFLAIPKGQTEAALSIGLRRSQVLRRIVLPQSLRIIIPPVGNQFVLLLKTTTLVSVIGGGDLLTRAQYIYGQNLLVIPLLVVATLWYLILVSVAQFGQHHLERALAADKTQQPPRLLRRLTPSLKAVLWRR